MNVQTVSEVVPVNPFTHMPTQHHYMYMLVVTKQQTCIKYNLSSFYDYLLDSTVGTPFDGSFTTNKLSQSGVCNIAEAIH